MYNILVKITENRYFRTDETRVQIHCRQKKNIIRTDDQSNHEQVASFCL